MASLMFAQFSSFSVPDVAGLVVAPCLAVCAILGVCQFGAGLREIRFIKSALWALGIDQFEDFVLLVTVHELVLGSKGQEDHGKMMVRLTAGPQQVATDYSRDGRYKQALSLLVEQGTQAILFEALDSQSKVLARLRFDVKTQILEAEEDIYQQVFPMKQRNKKATNPRLLLSMRQDSGEESSLVELGLGQRYSQEAPPSELEQAVRKVWGPVQWLSERGEEKVHLAVVGPPTQRKWTLGLWETQYKFQKGQQAKVSVDVMRISGVYPDPGQKDVFVVSYTTPDKKQQALQFRKAERPRDAWVDNMVTCIQQIRQDLEATKQ